MPKIKTNIVKSHPWLLFFSQKGETTMSDSFTHNPIRRQHSFIPDPYYRICMDALRVFSRGNVSLGTAIQIACREDERVRRADVRRYLLKWLREDSKFE